MARQDALDPVGKSLSRGLGPVGGCFDLVRRIALEDARGIGDLQPKHGLAPRRTAGVQAVRLADADRGDDGQHTAFGLIRGFRHAVDAVGQVDKRDVVQTGRQPVRGLVQRIMQLEVAAPVAEGGGCGAVIGQVDVAQQARHQLAGGHRGKHGFCRDGFACGQRHARHPSVALHDPVHIRLGADFTALRLDQAAESDSGLPGPALDHGRAGGFQRKGDDPAHLAGIGAFRCQSGVQHPGRPKRLCQRAVISFQPAACRGQGRAKPREQPARPALAHLAEQQFGGAPGPERPAQEREQKRRFGLNRAHIGRVPVPVPRGQRVQSRDVRGPVGGQNKR